MEQEWDVVFPTKQNSHKIEFYSAIKREILSYDITKGSKGFDHEAQSKTYKFSNVPLLSALEVEYLRGVAAEKAIMRKHNNITESDTVIVFYRAIEILEEENKSKK